MPRTNAMAWGVAAAALFAAAPALAQSYTLDKIEINGVTSVPVQPLRDGLSLHPGQKVTTDDLVAGQDQLAKELESAHVTGGVKTALRNKHNGHVDVIYDVSDSGIVQPKVIVKPLLIDHVSFAGNDHVSTDTLMAAAQMKPGDTITDETVRAAQKRVTDAYGKALTAKNLIAVSGVSILPQVTYPSPGQVDVVWRITEGKIRHKPRNTEDEGFHTE